MACRILALVALTWLAATPVRAQCVSNASSCQACHEIQGTHPHARTPWHVDHAFADLCASCHRGDPEAIDRETAHVGRYADPLADPGGSCASCHPKDSARRVSLYAGMTVAPPPAPPPSPPAGHPVDRVLALVGLALALGIWLLLPHRGPVAGWRARTWSPVATGAGLGLVVAFSEVGFGRPVAVAGAFDRLAAYLGRVVLPHSTYYEHVMHPAITWQVWLVLGLLVGSFVASRLAGEARWRWLPDTQWEPRFGPSRARRLVLAFSGAVLVQLGAGIAGGCTSGLAISGGAALAPAAFLFMAAMFVTGIPTAWLWSRGGKS